MLGQYRVNIRKIAWTGTCLQLLLKYFTSNLLLFTSAANSFLIFGVYLPIYSLSNSYIVCPCKINWIAVVLWLSTDFEMKSICKPLHLNCNFLVLFLIKREPSQPIQNLTQIFLFSEITIHYFHCTIPFQVYPFTALLKIKTLKIKWSMGSGPLQSIKDLVTAFEIIRSLLVQRYWMKR